MASSSRTSAKKDSGTYWSFKADRILGDFEWDSLGLCSPEEQIEMNTKELNNRARHKSAV